MTEKELRKLKRVDLFELLISQSRENEELKQQLKEVEQKLADKELKATEAGSIAEEALRLNGVFEAAEAAAEQYVANIKRQCDVLKEETKAKCEELLEEVQGRLQAYEKSHKSSDENLSIQEDETNEK